MKVGLTQRAETGTTYAPDAWDGNIGKEIPVNIGSRRVMGTVVSAVVAEDGLSVALTLYVDAALPEISPDLSPMSFGWSAPGERK